MQIGPHKLSNNLVLAPMAGVTDRPFRQLCRRLGAGLAVSEMLTSNPALYHTRKSQLRMDHTGEPGPRSVQIAGADPDMLAEAARYNVARGAAIIDINMGCPAKKVCNRAAGSALLADEPLVASILDAVVGAVDVPVTLKIRTGPSPERRNATRIAALAERSGIAALTVHGRTRADAYRGAAEYQTIRAVRQVFSRTLIANGDIDGPAKAAEVLEITGADGLMLGRAAQGQPWIFRELHTFLTTGARPAPPSTEDIHQIMHGHARALHDFYGPDQGLRVARKHLGWCLDRHAAVISPEGKTLRGRLLRTQCPQEQLDLFRACFADGEVADTHYRKAA